MMKIRVGVTGVGGGVGQSIIKALQMSSLDLDILAIGIAYDSAGLYFDGVRQRVISNLKGLDYPPADWHTMVRGNRLDCIIPGSDYDLKALSNVRDEWGGLGCKVLVSDNDLVSVCEDKYMTAQVLKNRYIDAPETFFQEHVNKFPVIVKPRVGSGSRGVIKVNSKEEMPEITYDLFIQEYLSGREYTCSVFLDHFGEVVGTFQLQRELKNGTTYKGRVVFEPEIHKLLVRIGKAFLPRGMLNVQLRMEEQGRGPVPFEINCRCSGTTAIRAHFGYNEPEMLIRHYVLGQRLETPKVKKGMAYRYWNETYKEVT